MRKPRLYRDVDDDSDRSQATLKFSRLSKQRLGARPRAAAEEPIMNNGGSKAIWLLLISYYILPCGVHSWPRTSALAQVQLIIVFITDNQSINTAELATENIRIPWNASNKAVVWYTHLPVGDQTTQDYPVQCCPIVQQIVNSKSETRLYGLSWKQDANSLSQRYTSKGVRIDTSQRSYIRRGWRYRTKSQQQLFEKMVCLSLFHWYGIEYLQGYRSHGRLSVLSEDNYGQYLITLLRVLSQSSLIDRSLWVHSWAC
jgi:hypothetical protein